MLLRKIFVGSCEKSESRHHKANKMTAFKALILSSKVERRIVVAVVALASFWCLLPHQKVWADEGEVTATRHCLQMSIDESSFWDHEDTRNYVQQMLHENYEKFGFMDWDCIVDEFESLSDNTYVKRADSPVTEGRFTYQFTVDRSNNIVIALLAIGPGKSKGKFTAVLSFFPNGQVALIQSDGKREWLKFE